MMHSLTGYISQKKKVLNIYFTAGYPKLNDTEIILKALEEGGADLIEIGIPYSDPVADGPVIQRSNAIALENGMNVKLLLSQIKNYNISRTDNQKKAPIILMGYFNPIMQYGVELFCQHAHEAGVAGLIIPDLPLDEFRAYYQKIFFQNQLATIFLITPETTEDRIFEIDQLTTGFIYAVSTFGTTGTKVDLNNQKEYLSRIQKMSLKNKVLVGFGISLSADFEFACQYAHGAIIGSAFIQAISMSGDLEINSKLFINSILLN